MKYKIAISTGFGLEAVLKRELYQELGVKDAPANGGMVRIEGDEETVARCNLYLRTAERVYIVPAEGEVTTFDQLFVLVSSVRWADLLPQNARIIVNGKSVASTLFGVSACQSITKKAIVVSLQRAYRVEQLPETGPTYQITVSLLKDYATILVDTSGTGLHKRGYRELVGEAAIKETMAAGLLLLSIWNKDKPLIDPFCGSGTIPIEAALIARRIAPGLYRNFAFESWPQFAPSLMDDLRKEAEGRIDRTSTLHIAGFDIDPNAIKLCRHHAKRAGVESDVHFQCMDMRQVSSHTPYGVIVTNPPYGERLLTEKEVGKLMQDFSAVFRALPKWSCYVITAFAFMERYFGRKADKNRKLYNGKLECRYYQFMGEKPPKKEN